MGKLKKGKIRRLLALEDYSGVGFDREQNLVKEEGEGCYPKFKKCASI